MKKDSCSEILYYLKVLLLCLALSIFCAFFIDPVWGFYDSFMASLASGNLGGVIIRESYHLGLSPMAKVLAPLHYYFPNLPWTALIIFISLIYIQSVVIFLLLKLSKQEKFVFRKAFITWWLLMLFVFGFSFIEFSITGTGILLSFIAVLGMWHLFNNRPSTFVYWLSIIVLSLTFIAAYSLRIESGLGGTAIGTLFIFTAELSVGRLLKIIWFPVCLTILFFIRFQFAINSQVFFRDVEPLVFYVTDSHNAPPLTAIDSIDAVKLKMVRASVLIDTTYLNYPLFKRLADEKWAYEKQLGTHPQDIFYQAKKTASPTINTNKTITGIYLLLLLGLLFYAYSLTQKRLLYQLLFFNVGICLVITFLAYAMKMEKWHYIPLIQSSLLSNILLLAFLREKNFLATKNWIVNFGIILVGFLSLYFYSNEIKANRQMVDEKTKIAATIFAERNDKLLFFDVNTREILDDYVFRNCPKRKNIYFYDMAQLPFLPAYEAYLNRCCKCNSHKANEFFGFMKKKSTSINYYSTTQRVELLSSYMKTLYQTDVTFQPVKIIELKKNSYGISSLTKYTIVFQDSSLKSSVTKK